MACRFCNQMNPKLSFKYITSVYKGNPVNLCHILKQLTVKQLDDETVTNIIDLYTWVENNFIKI